MRRRAERFPHCHITLQPFPSQIVFSRTSPLALFQTPLLFPFEILNRLPFKYCYVKGSLTPTWEYDIKMPRIILPPTPQPSTDIAAKSAPPLSGLELSFALPPPALEAIVPSNLKVASTCYFDSSAPTSSLSSSTSSSYQPLSPTSPGIAERGNTPADAPKKRRRSSVPEKPKSQPRAQKRKTEKITLPPPPSRRPKIIQMQPQQSPSSSASSADGPSQSTPPEPNKSRKAAAKADKPGDDEKPTTAVGRKIARKTAHSLIERRRRFKMNEEFGVLKGMIPACKGVEMHKLAILQVIFTKIPTTNTKCTKLIIFLGEYRIFEISRKMCRRSQSIQCCLLV